MKQYVVGIDGGGTKTELAAVGPDGEAWFRLRTGPINVTGAPEQEIFYTLKGLLTDAIKKAGGSLPAAVCIGAAGTSNPRAEKVLRSALLSAECTAPLLVVGDHQAALAGALGRPVGMLLISGTGSICSGRNEDGYEARTGGYGHLIDDEGSGYAIGRDILSAVVRSLDGRLPPTVFTDLVFKKLGITTIEQLIAEVYRPDRGKEFIAGFSSLLPEAVKHKDSAAIRISEQAGTELCALVGPVARKLGMQRGRLALSGSVLLNDEAVREALKREMKKKLPGLETALPLSDAASGAALLARQFLLRGAAGHAD